MRTMSLMTIFESLDEEKEVVQLSFIMATSSSRMKHCLVPVLHTVHKASKLA